jgi:hypothetical protein
MGIGGTGSGWLTAGRLIQAQVAQLVCHQSPPGAVANLPTNISREFYMANSKQCAQMIFVGPSPKFINIDALYS